MMIFFEGSYYPLYLSRDTSSGSRKSGRGKPGVENSELFGVLLQTVSVMVQFQGPMTKRKPPMYGRWKVRW